MIGCSQAQPLVADNRIGGNPSWADSFSRCGEGWNHATHWMAHAPPHLFVTVEGNKSGYQSDAGTAPTCLEPGHFGHFEAGSHASQAQRTKRCQRPDAHGVYWDGLRSAAAIVPICACEKRLGLGINTCARRTRSGKLCSELCLFVPARSRSHPARYIERIWRPRRDSNPCYRRERALTDWIT
jgi:hypothetical protein